MWAFLTQITASGLWDPLGLGWQSHGNVVFQGIFRGSKGFVDPCKIVFIQADGAVQNQASQGEQFLAHPVAPVCRRATQTPEQGHRHWRRATRTVYHDISPGPMAWRQRCGKDGKLLRVFSWELGLFGFHPLGSWCCWAPPSLWPLGP